MPTPNAPLLWQVLGLIETHLDRWFQGAYRCGSGLCYAGLTCELDGGQWAINDPDHSFADHLIAVPEDDPSDVMAARAGADPVRTITAHDRARRLLDLDEDQADELFDPHNDLDELRRIVAEICAGAEASS